MKPIRVAELFAGVGGFRIGLEAANRELGYEAFRVVWSNQWEPSTKVQHASDVYIRAFGTEGHSNEDIAKVPADAIPDVDMVVGGFPCQDYSVATTLQKAGGIAGRKGVLWWEIHRILRDKSPRPRYLLLENVDRLLKSPSTQRGRDFAIMLSSLANLGYAVEWRVINAADYGMPQRRRRVFILGYLRGTSPFERLADEVPSRWLGETGLLARAFPVKEPPQVLANPIRVDEDLVAVTQGFNVGARRPSPFMDAGVMVERFVSTLRVEPAYTGPRITLGDVLLPEDQVPEEYFINGEVEKWRFLKGAKVLERKSRSNGHVYQYAEGGIPFPDPLDRPSRTIITAEGGRTPSRFKHVVACPSGRLRRLVPVELERLNMFPDNHTLGVPDPRRAFLMGNALVTGIVRDIGRQVALASVGHTETQPSEDSAHDNLVAYAATTS
jgi:DNA (cytosine-5)-methyltransferase 1